MLPRLRDLETRVGIIVTANPEAFVSPVAERLRRPIVWSNACRMKTIYEHSGELEARRLLEWDYEAQSLMVFEGSFKVTDSRSNAEELDSPTILAWRLLEDLCDAAEWIEHEIGDELAAWESQAAGHAEHAGHGRVPSNEELVRLTDEALRQNPQFFPPWLMDRLDQGTLVSPKAPSWDQEAVGFFEETLAGNRIVLVAPNLKAEARDRGYRAMVRELLLTLCHEVEHHFGCERGYDPMAEREAFFDEQEAAKKRRRDRRKRP